MPSAAADVPPVAAAHQQGQITSGYELSLLEVKSGLLAHAVVHATFTVPPAAVLSVLNAPHDLHVARQTLLSEPGYEVTAVTMKGDFRILMKRKEFEQVVRIEADGRDPERLIFRQEIMQSEVMNVQTNHWELVPIRGANSEVVGTAAVYELHAQVRLPAVVRRLPMAKKTTHRATLSLLKGYIEDQLAMSEGVGMGLSLVQARERLARIAEANQECSGRKEVKVVPFKQGPSGTAGGQGSGGKTPAVASTTTVRAFLLDDMGDDEESEGSSDTQEEREPFGQQV